MKASSVLALCLFTCSAIAANAQATPSRDDKPHQLKAAATMSKPASPAFAANYGKLPLSFEANQGQTDPQVKFLSRGSGYSLFLTNSAAVLALTKGDPAKDKPASLAIAGKTPKRAIKPVKTDVVRMELAGASHGLRVTGAEQLPGTANYFIGNDPTKWRSNVSTYAKVKYAGVYPGIDLVYYGNQRQLEYDFVVAPGADPTQAKLHFAGAKKLKLDGDGDLEVVARNGEIAFRKPVVYQELNGQRQPVEGQFKLLAKGTIGFSLGKYDPSRAVVIDPTLAYSTYLGGAGSYQSIGGQGTAIAVDSAGNAYVVGTTSVADFPTTSGAYQVGLSGNQVNSNSTYAFVAKLDPTGSKLIYATYLAGGGSVNSNGTYLSFLPGDSISSIAVDSAGDAYVAGATYSPSFPVTSAFQSTNRSQGS